MRIKMECLGGRWKTLSNGQCKKRSCGHPEDTPFGSFELKDGHEFVFGAVVEYTCDEGYQMMSKHKTRTCAADGWTNQPPHCEVLLCPPVRDDTVRVLSTVQDDEFSMGHVITLECKNPEHRLKGPSSIYCTANGTWNMDPPTCKGSCIIQENDMRENNVRLKDNGVLYYEDNEHVQFDCVSGYKISDPAKLLTQCNSSILIYPTCHKIDSCAKPPEIKNAILEGNWDEESFPEGHTASYRCHPGYVLHMRIKMECLGGRWKTLSNGQCKKRSCGHPGDTPFGSFELKHGHEFVFGAVVEYTCDEGYQMMSKYKTRTCGADGWTNQPPHCEVRLCPPVRDDSVIVLSTVQDDEFSMGHVITLECKNPKHRLKGPSSIYCTANGTWNMAPPTCKGSCIIQEKDMRENNVRLKDNGVLYYEDNEHVQFDCVSGYKISDPAKLMTQCNSGILIYPTCHKIEFLDQLRGSAIKHVSVSTSCGRPPRTLHGEITTPMRDSYHSGSSVTYKCPYLHMPQGRAVIKCQRGMWGAPPICLVPCTTSETNMTENHITLLWNHRNKKHCFIDEQKKRHAKKCYVKHNDIIQFSCLSGYKIFNPKDLISQCNNGTLSYPRCLKKGKLNYT